MMPSPRLSVLLMVLLISPALGARRSLFLRLLVVRSRQTATRALDLLQGGTPFGELARQFSIDPSGPRGGWLGRVKLNQLNDEFRRVAEHLRPGSASRIFNSGGDFVILYRMARAFQARAIRLQEEGEVLFRQGEIGEAIERYRQALAVNPDLAQAYFSLGVAYGEAGEVEKERESYQEAIRIAPDFAQAHYNLGRLLMAQGESAAAVRRLRKAVEIKADYAEALVNLSALYLARGEARAAIDAARRAVEINPLLASAHYNLGVALGHGDLEAALDSFEMAATIDPGRLDAQLNAAVALLGLGRRRAAKERLEGIVSRNPAYRPAQDALDRLRETRLPRKGSATTGGRSLNLAAQGRQALKEKRFGEAAELFERALAGNPDSKELIEGRSNALLALGRSEQRLGRWESARQSWQRALEGNPNSVPVLEALVEASTRNGDFGTARDYLRRARELEPHNSRLILLSSRLSYEQRDLQQAFQKLRLLRLDHLDNQTAAGLAQQLLRLGLVDQAMALANRMSLTAPQKVQLAQSLIQKGRFEPALRLLEPLDTPGARLQLAHLYLRQLKFERAEPILKQLIEAYPNFAPAYVLLGRLYLDSGQAQSALSVLEEAHRLQPGSVTPLHQLGLANWQSGESERALKWLHQGLQLEPDDSLLNYELGRILLEEGNLSGALGALLEVLKQEPDHIRAHYLLGSLYRELGDSQKARYYLDRFQALRQRLEKERVELKRKRQALEGERLSR
ncbi:MAG: tetratricopeptide repeat protein [Acidobacteriota bacterium]